MKFQKSQPVEAEHECLPLPRAGKPSRLIDPGLLFLSSPGRCDKLFYLHEGYYHLVRPKGWQKKLGARCTKSLRWLLEKHLPTYLPISEHGGFLLLLRRSKSTS
jgi:hypothetical protein